MLSDNIWSISLSFSRQNPLQMILVLALCKTLTRPLATDHLSSNCIDLSLKMFLYPLPACCQMEQAPSNCRRFNSNQHFHKFPLTTTSPKLGARQKLWKCFWRLNANVRFQIELKHFALTIATKNVYLTKNIFHPGLIEVQLNQKLSQWSRLSKFRIIGGTS